MGLESLGWCPDIADARDFLLEEIQRNIPHAIDLRDYEFGIFGISDPKHAHMSCAISLLGMLDWQQRKWHGRPVSGSPEFLHDLTIRIWGGGGASGVGLRNVLKTLKRFGTPPQSLIVRESRKPLLDQPELFGYSHDYEFLEFIRLDSHWYSSRHKIDAMKYWLFSGDPFVIGFAVPNHVTRDSKVIPLDIREGGTLGGTAGIVMGFDDRYPTANHVRGHHQRIENSKRGAFLVLTCWGNDWGNNGFVWLPYAFIESGFARDAWATENNCH